MIYVLKIPDTEDIPPANIILFGRKSGMSLSFAWVLDQCHINTKVKDADKVLFFAEANHMLGFKYSGDSTIVKASDILLQNKNYSLCYGEKILLIFNDGDIEIELHYKNIKPSER